MDNQHTHDGKRIAFSGTFASTGKPFTAYFKDSGGDNVDNQPNGYDLDGNPIKYGIHGGECG